MPDPRRKHAASPKEVPALKLSLDTRYEDPFWADLAERIMFAGRIKEGVFRFPSREARKFWLSLERSFCPHSRPRGA